MTLQVVTLNTPGALPVVLLDLQGALEMAAASQGRLAALVADRRAIAPQAPFSDWGATRAADVGLISALALYVGLPPTMKPGGCVAVWGLTVVHFETWPDACAWAWDLQTREAA